MKYRKKSLEITDNMKLTSSARNNDLNMTLSLITAYPLVSSMSP